jgi:hypothetical protein
MKRLVALFMFLLLAMPAFAQQPCTKVVSFGHMAPTPQGARLIHYNIPDGTSKGWLNNWVRKNAKNYPDVCFLPNPMKDHANFLVVLSDSPRFFQGFQATTVYNTSTSYVSGSGTATDNYGGTWDFAYNGNVTTTTATRENVPYEISTNVLYANAYNDDGALVSQRYHVYSTQTGGDPYAGFGYNLGNALRAINARGRLITSVVQDLAGPAQKKTKSDPRLENGQHIVHEFDSGDTGRGAHPDEPPPDSETVTAKWEAPQAGGRTNRPALVGRAAPTAQPTAVARPASKSETTSFGVAGYATDEGFKVTSVREESVAERIFIFIGDVIWEIDGKPVRSGQDVDSAIAANKGGTIKVRNGNVIPSVRALKLP